MSFAPETEKLANELIQAEYKNACEKFGDKYHSLHEGYAILLEEVEEARSEFDKLVINTERIWKEIKDFNNSIYDRNELICLYKKATDHTYDTISELAQVGAVFMKIKNTIVEVKENE